MATSAQDADAEFAARLAVEEVRYCAVQYSRDDRGSRGYWRLCSWRWFALFGLLIQEFEVATAKVLEQQDAKVAARTQRKLVAEAVKADREVGCCCVTSFFVLTACLTG